MSGYEKMQRGAAIHVRADWEQLPGLCAKDW